jgi:hypothetical protein
MQANVGLFEGVPEVSQGAKRGGRHIPGECGWNGEYHEWAGRRQEGIEFVLQCLVDIAMEVSHFTITSPGLHDCLAESSAGDFHDAVIFGTECQFLFGNPAYSRFATVTSAAAEKRSEC